MDTFAIKKQATPPPPMHDSLPSLIAPCHRKLAASAQGFPRFVSPKQDGEEAPGHRRFGKLFNVWNYPAAFQRVLNLFTLVSSQSLSKHIHPLLLAHISEWNTLYNTGTH